MCSLFPKCCTLTFTLIASFFGVITKKHRACHIIVSSCLFLCSVARRNCIFSGKYGNIFWEAAHPHSSSLQCFWGSSPKNTICQCVIYVKHVNNLRYYKHLSNRRLEDGEMFYYVCLWYWNFFSVARLLAHHFVPSFRFFDSSMYFFVFYMNIDFFLP